MKRILCLALAFSIVPGSRAFAETINLKPLVAELRSPRSEIRARGAAALGKLGPLATGAVVPVQLEVLLAIENIGPAARAAIPDLVRILRGDNAKLYGGAIDALGAIGRDSLEAAPVLIDLLKGDDAAVAASAGLALARIIPDDVDGLRQVVPILIEALKDKRTQVRSTAVVGLGLSGGAAVPALADLVKGHATDADSAWQAAAALELIGPPAQPSVAVLVDALQSPNEKVIIHAASALGTIGSEARPALPQLRKLLGRENSAIRAHAVRALGGLGAAAQPAVSDLVKALKDRDSGVRREAARALGKIGPAARLAVPALLTAMNDTDGTVTMQAAMALGHIGPDAVPGLVSVLKDENLRHLAVMILADIGPAAKSAVEALASMELDPDVDREFRREVLLALARIGPDARGAVPVLMQILGDKEHTLRPGAAWALAKIGAKEAAPLLVKAVAEERNTRLAVVAPIALAVLSPDNDAYVSLALPKLVELLGHEASAIRFETASAITAIGPRAGDAVPKLAAALKEPDPALRSAYLAALGAIGPAAVAALPELLTALADPEFPIRYAATYAVGRIGEGAQEAIPVLEKNLQERDDMLQIASAWALVEINPKRGDLAGECVAPLMRALKLADPHSRSEGAAALGRIGPSARSAAGALEELARDPDETVRKTAAEALKKIGR
jgi:HEAT repeat protein